MENSTHTLMYFNLHMESGIFFSTISSATMILLAWLLYYYAQTGSNSLGTTTNNGILFFCVLSTFMADFLTNRLLRTFKTFTAFKMTLFGIIMPLGTKYLFTVPAIDSDEESFGKHHKNVSLIVWIVTIPLVFTEIAHTILTQVRSPNGYDIILNMLAIVQKLIQGGMYHFVLRHRTPMESRRLASSWFFRIMALFNFSMWLQSIISGEKERDFSDAINFEEVLVVLNSTYFALMIDYRLLCCLLFLEHSHEVTSKGLFKGKLIEYQFSENSSSYVNLPDTWENFYKTTKKYTRCGYLVGTILFLTQFVNALQFIKQVGPWVNIFGFLADFGVVVQGYILIKQARPISKSKRKWRESNSKGVDLMVAMMGVSGLLFLLTKSMILISWCTRDCNADIAWSTAKIIFRSCTCVFFIYLYIRADLHMGCQSSIMYKRINHFLIPSLMMCFLSVFVNSIIDSQAKYIKHLVKKQHIVLYAFYEAGIPLHLGFLFHLFIHYLLIKQKMKDALKSSERRYCVEEDKQNVIRSSFAEDGDDNHEMLKGLLDGQTKFRTC